MVRTLALAEHDTKVTFVLGARTTQDMIHRHELVALSENQEWFDLILWPSAALGHFNRAALFREIPDWQSAQTLSADRPGFSHTPIRFGVLRTHSSACTPNSSKPGWQRSTGGVGP